MVISVHGDIVSDKVVSLVNQHFKLSSSDINTDINTDKPYFTPSIMAMRDDEMANVNFGVFFNAPTYKDKDHYAMYYL